MASAIVKRETTTVTRAPKSTGHRERRVITGNLDTVVRRMELKDYAIAGASIAGGIVVYNYLEPKILEADMMQENFDSDDTRRYVIAAGLLYAGWRFRHKLPATVTFGLVGGGIAAAAKPFIDQATEEEAAA